MRSILVLTSCVFLGGCVSDSQGMGGDSGTDTGTSSMDSGGTDGGTTDGMAMDTGTGMDGAMQDQDSGPPPWTPQSLAGLKVWLDGSDHTNANKITLDMSNKVTQWKDLSGNGNSANPYQTALPAVSVSVFQNGKTP